MLFRIFLDLNPRFTGVPSGRMKWWEEELEKAAIMEVDVEPLAKIFKKKCLNVETLDSYKEEDLVGKQEWWDTWVKNPLVMSYNGPKLKVEEIIKVAEEVAFPWKTKVQEICSVMQHGADLGIVGEGRWKTEGVNTTNAILEGEKLVDSLQASVILGHMKGPLTKEEVSVLGDIKIIPIDTRPKPNGSIRIIINMSDPHNKVYDKELECLREARVGDGVALSPNMGQSDWLDFEPCFMSSSADFRMAMFSCGRGCRFCKSDWSHAYKHVPVRCEDWGMQCLKFGGRYFVETALTFGGCNSPSIYRMVASYVKEVTEVMVGFDPRHSVMVLDDLCSVGAAGDTLVDEFFQKYRETAARMNVELAPLDDPGKAFLPCTKGEILGLVYDSESWTWSLPLDKARRLLALLWSVLRDRGATSKIMMVLMGRLNHYMLVVGGKYERGFLYSKLKGKELAPEEWVELDNDACVQAWWWILNIKVVIAVGAPLLDPREHFAVASVELCSDAAGGDSKQWKGCGAYCEESNEFVQWKWPRFILENKLHLGQRWGRKLTLLEGLAAFVGLLAWLPKVVKRGSVILRVDNTGFVYAFKKGHSRDLFVYTIVKAMRYIADQLEFKIHVIHVSRRTSEGDKIVDYLSKGEDDKVMGLVPGVSKLDIWSKRLINWIARPVVSFDLGRQIMLESGIWRNRVGRDFKGDMRSVSQLLQWKKKERGMGGKRMRDECE